VGDVSCQLELKSFVDSRVNTNQIRTNITATTTTTTESVSGESILKHNDGDRKETLLTR
jgi:hypothetical protein